MNTTKKTKRVLIAANSNNEGAKLIKQWLIAFGTVVVGLDTDQDLFCITRYDLEKTSYHFAINEVEYEASQFTKIYFHRGALRIKGSIDVQENRGDFTDYDNALKYYLTSYEVSIKELILILKQLRKMI
jgi:hypothetical protein